MGNESTGLRPQSGSEKLQGDPLDQTLAPDKKDAQKPSSGGRRSEPEKQRRDQSVEERQDELGSAGTQPPSDSSVP